MILGLSFFSTVFLVCFRFQDISAKGSSIKLDLEDNDQYRESKPIMSAVSLMPIIAENCMSYTRPAGNKMGKLLVDILKNLEEDHSFLTQNLVDSLNRSRFFVGSKSDNDENMFEALVKNTYYVSSGEPTIFPRIMAIVWLLIADPAVNRKVGWCPLKKITSYISSSNPSEVARKFSAQRHILSRARFVMEEFISENAAIQAYLESSHSVKRESHRRSRSTKARVQVETESIVRLEPHTFKANIEKFVKSHSFKEVVKERINDKNTFSINDTVSRCKANYLCVSFNLNIITLFLNIIFIL